MSLQKFSNNADTFLPEAVPLGATSFLVMSGDGALFPDLGDDEFFYVRIGSDDSNEVVKVTDRDVNTFTCVATTSAWSAGTQVSLTVSAEMLENFIQQGMDISGIEISEIEISDYVESIVEETPIEAGGGTLNLDLSIPYHVITLDRNVGLVTFSNKPPSGVAASYTLEVIQGTGAPWSITWPGGVRTPGGEAIALQSVLSEHDLLVLITRDGGTTFDLLLAGAAMS